MSASAIETLGRRLAELFVRRLRGASVDYLAGEFKIAPDELRTLFSRHGDPAPWHQPRRSRRRPVVSGFDHSLPRGDRDE